MEVLACIPSEHTLKMKLDQDNTKAVKSPPIHDKFSIHTDGVYNYIINELRNDNYDKSYIILVELKKLIRCVWQTRFTRAEYPNVKFLKQVSSFNKILSPFGGNKVLFIYPTDRFSSKPAKLDEEALITIERNLIPSFDYNLSKFTDKHWDQYLLIFDNILLSEIIQYRKEQIRIRDEDIKSLQETKNDISIDEYNEQYQIILDDYTNKIDSIKNDYIFKAINYLNYLYYNNANSNVNSNTDNTNTNSINTADNNITNRDIVWSVVLLRLSTITHNIYHNEQIKHNEEDITTYIYNCKRDTKFELLQFYVAIIVYMYQFKHHSITIYDKEYLEIMIQYLTDTLPTYDEYIDKLYRNITDNLIILRHLIPTIKLMEHIKQYELTKFSYKLKGLSAELHKYYTVNELTNYDIEDRIKYLIDSSDINKLFNKITSKTYKEISKQLENYNVRHVYNCFIEIFLNSFSPTYTFYTIHYMIEHFHKPDLSRKILEHFKKDNIDANGNVIKPKVDGKLIGILMDMFNSDKYYQFSRNKIDTLSEITKNEPSKTILKFALSEANKLLTDGVKGYEKFTLETAIETINSMLPKPKDTNKEDNTTTATPTIKKSSSNNKFAALMSSDEEEDI